MTHVDVGRDHTCAILDAGGVKCWGFAASGQLGYGSMEMIGDNEPPASADEVEVGGVVTQIALGGQHTTALLQDGTIRSWGDNEFGQLGYGNTNDIGDDEAPASAGNVPVGGPAIQITAGDVHTCALMSTGGVRCWGDNEYGQLGYGHTRTLGDDETPADIGDIDLGGTAVAIASRNRHTCAVLETAVLLCWGLGSEGRLGYGNPDNIGDDEVPAAAGKIEVGDRVLQVATGGAHTCAVLGTMEMRCWGMNSVGELGLPGIGTVGDDEVPASTEPVALGGLVLQVAANGGRTCAVLLGGGLRCWGKDAYGELGYGTMKAVGDDETPESMGDLTVGGSVVQVAAGTDHSCALLEDGTLRCWGLASKGQLGYGNTELIGDDETPASAGAVPVF